MRKILVFQHVAHEPLGTLDPLLKAAGFRIRYVNFGRDPLAEPDVDGYNGLIILGGPMGVYEAHKHTHLLWEMKQIEKAFKKNIPVLGICLGSQLMAAVLGSHVRKAPRWELGWTEIKTTEHASKDSVFQHYNKAEKIFQIHQDTFDIPKTAIHLASSELCDGQAFRYGDKAYALQYHLEVDQPMIQRWMKRPENYNIVVSSDGSFSIETIRSETEKYISSSLALSNKTFQSFIDLFNLPPRIERPKSR